MNNTEHTNNSIQNNTTIGTVARQPLATQEGTGLSMADIVLALIYANGCSPIASKKKLYTTIKYLQEKLGKAFNLEETVTSGALYSFEFGEYGYWSVDLLTDIEQLAEQKMISVRKLEARNYQASTYYLTGAGKKAVENYIHPRLTRTQILILSQLKDMALSNAL